MPPASSTGYSTTMRPSSSAQASPSPVGTPRWRWRTREVFRFLSNQTNQPSSDSPVTVCGILHETKSDESPRRKSNAHSWNAPGLSRGPGSGARASAEPTRSRDQSSWLRAAPGTPEGWGGSDRASPAKIRHTKAGTRACARIGGLRGAAATGSSCPRHSGVLAQPVHESAERQLERCIGVARVPASDDNASGGSRWGRFFGQ